MRNHKVSRGNWIWYNYLFLMQHFFGYDYVKEKIKRLYLSIKINKKTQNNLENFVSKNLISNESKIILLKGYAADWECTKKWSLDFFKSNYGNQPISLINASGLVSKNSQNNYEDTTLIKYIEELEEGSKKYLVLSDLVNKIPELQNDINLSWLNQIVHKGSTGKTFYSFIGGRGTKTPMHNEFPVNIYIQVWGKKRWILYPPNNHIFLNAITERRPYFFSNAIPDELDNPDFPLLKFADKIDIILEPGDVLIVPPFTWHYVENITDSIAVAYKYANIFQSLKSSVFFTFFSLMSTNPFILQSFILNRIKKSDYVLKKV